MPEAIPCLTKLVVLDCGVGMSAALVAHYFSELGATVFRSEPESGDPFYSVYPAYRIWHQRSQRIKDTEIESTLKRADVCIIGGEDFPGLNIRKPASEFALRNPKAIILDLSGYLSRPDVPFHPAVDILVQARTGLSFTQYADRPIQFAFPAPTYGAALQGLVGIWAALIERLSSGKGQIVKTSLEQGAAMWPVQDWHTEERPTQWTNAKIPLGVRPAIFQTRDDKYIQIALQLPGSVEKFLDILGLEPDAKAQAAAGYLKPDPALFFGDIAAWQTKVAQWDRDALLPRLSDAGIAADAVGYPGECWITEQVQCNGIIQTAETGERYVGLPMRTAAHSAAPSDNDKPKKPIAGPYPLSGYDVVNFGSYIAGHYAGKLLADLGAEVIRVEPSVTDGNIAAHWAWSLANRGKRSIEVDLKSESGQEIVRRLCGRARVVGHNFRPGVAARLGLDNEKLRTLSPGIVIIESTSYGALGPKSQAPAFDMVIQSVSGHQIRAGGIGNRPENYRHVVVDISTGALGAIACLVGLYVREQEGRSVSIESSLMDTGIFLMSELIQKADGSWSGAPILNSQQTGMHPAEAMYRTSDGWVAVAARTAQMADAFATALDLQLPSFENWSESEASKLNEKISPLSTAAFLALLKEANVWAEICKTDGWEGLRQDQVARDAGLVIEFRTDEFGLVTTTGPLFTLSRTPIALANCVSAPKVGEHTDEVLREIGIHALET